MTDKIMGYVLFVLGLTIGSIATNQYLQKKYENIVQEELDSVKEVIINGLNPTVKDSQHSHPDLNKQRDSESEIYGNIWESDEDNETDIKEYEELIETSKYANSSERPLSEEKREFSPYVISPEEFGEIEEYEKCALLYYSDHVLAYEDGELVDTVDSIIGEGSLDHFGEYEEDSVFVRNDGLKCDYEILLEPRNFYSDD